MKAYMLDIGFEGEVFNDGALGNYKEELIILATSYESAFVIAEKYVKRNYTTVDFNLNEFDQEGIILQDGYEVVPVYDI